MLMSQNTQNTQTPLKTGSQPYVYSYFLLDSGPLIHFRWINLKLYNVKEYNCKIYSRNFNWVLTYRHDFNNRANKITSDSRIKPVIKFNSRSME